MRNQIILIGTLFLTSINLCGQLKKSDLIGTWELTKEESEIELESLSIFEKSNDTIKNEKKEIKIILKFNKNNELDLIQYGEPYKVKYKLIGSNLTLGSSSYKVLKLTVDSLLMINDTDLFPKKFYYQKSNKQIKPIKEFVDVEKRHLNGKLKIKGTLHNGFEDGLWIEWYDNGQKKSERLFKNGIPNGIWKEWDEDGKLIKKEK